MVDKGAIGAASELRACAYLLDLGYHVFRSESPNAPFDLVAYRDGVCLRVEVKTIRPLPPFAPSVAVRAEQNQWDLLVLVLPDRVMMFDSSKSIADIRGDVRETYGWPRQSRPDLRPCGTFAALSRHRARGEALCPACREVYEVWREARRTPKIKTEVGHDDPA